MQSPLHEVLTLSKLSHGSVPESLMMRWNAKENAINVGIQMVAICNAAVFVPRCVTHLVLPEVRRAVDSFWLRLRLFIYE